MRILFVHNYSRESGGQELVLGLEERLLKAAGHQVEIFSVSSSKLEAQALWRRLPRYASVLYAWGEARRLTRQLEGSAYDIVHLHNLSPYLGPAVLAAVPEGLRCVQSLHNFQAFCVNGLFMRDGQACEDCGSGNVLPGILHRCQQESLASSSLYAGARIAGSLKGAWMRPERYLCSSRFLASRYASYGYPPEKLKLVFHTVEEGKESSLEGKGGLYLGRLSPEKGLKSLIAALKLNPFPFVIAGAGNQEKELKRDARELSGLQWVPSPDSSGVERLLSEAAYLVMPSTYYENMPTEMLWAMSSGLPLIASKLGCMEELIENGRNGYLFEAGNPESLALAIRSMEAQGVEGRKAMGQRSRELFKQFYAPEAHLASLLRTYQGY